MIIYAICLVLGLVFTIFSALLGHLFGGHDSLDAGGHAESGLSQTGEPGISFFSPTVLATFVTAFGAVGLILTKIPATHSVDAIQNKGLTDGEKIGWVLAIVFLHIIGALLYYFIGRPKRNIFTV